ncbi:MAG: cytochrome C oxidase subunit IV family protein [Verrucomicrobiales bacterium]|nr:cytochrome C oxidase subunit IV family protein [Verrucomicrobiales bacterium]
MSLSHNAKVWLVLSVFTIGSFSLGVRDSGIHGTFWILLLALGKALFLGFRFMELQAAHPAWKCAFVGTLGILTGFLLGVASRVG